MKKRIILVLTLLLSFFSCTKTKPQDGIYVRERMSDKTLASRRISEEDEKLFYDMFKNINEWAIIKTTDTEQTIGAGFNTLASFTMIKDHKTSYISTDMYATIIYHNGDEIATYFADPLCEFFDYLYRLEYQYNYDYFTEEYSKYYQKNKVPVFPAYLTTYEGKNIYHYILSNFNNISELTQTIKETEDYSPKMNYEDRSISDLFLEKYGDDYGISDYVLFDDIIIKIRYISEDKDHIVYYAGLLTNERPAY